MVATIGTEDPVSVAVTSAIHAGDLVALKALLVEHPQLATARLGDDEAEGISRTLLHVVTDWPGHFPNGAATVGVLVDAGADVNARFRGPHEETPLHWAASSDDVEVLDALLDAGADIEAPGAVLGGGPPLADARGFKQWRVAFRLVERGARTTLVDAATLGLHDRVEGYFTNVTPPSKDVVTHAFWGACHGGRLRCAEYLLHQGAELDWVPPWENLTPLDAAEREHVDELAGWLRDRGAKRASELPTKRRTIEFLWAWLDALRRGDTQALAAALATDIVWQGIREDLSCRGPEEVVAGFVSGYEERREIASLELVAGPTKIVLAVRGPDLGEVEGVALGTEFCNVFTIENEKIVRIEDFQRRDEALAAAGLA